MITALADQTVAFSIDLKSPFDGVTATTWTLRGHNGLPLPGYVDVAGTPSNGGTTLLVTIPGAANAKTLPTENRFIVVSRAHPSGTIIDQFRYQIVDFYPIMAPPSTVRGVFGLNAAELADDDVNLTAAYLALVAEYGSVFTAAIAAGGAMNDNAQRLVVLRAALDVLPSLKLRASASQNTDQVGFSRFQTVKLDDVARGVRDEYNRLLGAISPTVTPTVPDLFGPSANRADPFPGA